jgi:hypothetical protein
MLTYPMRPRRRKPFRAHPAQLDLFQHCPAPVLYPPPVHVLAKRARLPLHIAAVFAANHRFGGFHV